MTQIASKYSVELVSPTGQVLADLSARARDRALTLSRNEADDIRWTLDLNEFEAWCSASNQNPESLLVTNLIEVRVRRLGVPIAGGQLTHKRYSITQDGGSISLTADGFLNLFNSRITAAVQNYTNVERTAVAADLINQSQALPDGNFGITIGPNQATMGVCTRSYERNNIKEALQNFTTVQTNPFDIEFTYDKQFNTYAAIGSDRPDIVFEYPGNIKELSVEDDGTGLANEITVLGSGIGDIAQIVVVKDDPGSRSIYKLRQKSVSRSDSNNTDGGLDDEAARQLARWGFPFEIPELTIDGNRAPYFTDYHIGDRVRVRITRHPLFSHINGTYRIERLELAVDEDDNEIVRVKVA